jgi:hypothetical protein
VAKRWPKDLDRLRAGLRAKGDQVHLSGHRGPMDRLGDDACRGFRLGSHGPRAGTQGGGTAHASSESGLDSRAGRRPGCCTGARREHRVMAGAWSRRDLRLKPVLGKRPMHRKRRDNRGLTLERHHGPYDVLESRSTHQRSCGVCRECDADPEISSGTVGEPSARGFTWFRCGGTRTHARHRWPRPRARARCSRRTRALRPRRRR